MARIRAVFTLLLFVFCASSAHACDGVEGLVSWYGENHHGKRTASGSIFNQWAMTAAMPKRSQFGTYRVTSGGKSVTVRVNDTGGFAKYGRGMDLSRGAFSKLAHEDKGVIKACWERLR